MASSKLVLRTLVSSAYWRAFCKNCSLAASKAVWPSPPTSLSMTLKPAFEPSPRTAGGCMTNTLASRMLASAWVARWATSPADWLGKGRWAQVFSRTKPRAELWSPLKPDTWLKLTTSGWARKYSRTWSSTCCSRASAAPAGKFTLTKTKPWSSSGKNEVGNRCSSTHMTIKMARKISSMRLLRCKILATPLW